MEQFAVQRNHRFLFSPKIADATFVESEELQQAIPKLLTTNYLFPPDS